jgi:hypothetical protein
MTEKLNDTALAENDLYIAGTYRKDFDRAKMPTGDISAMRPATPEEVAFLRNYETSPYELASAEASATTSSAATTPLSGPINLGPLTPRMQRLVHTCYNPRPVAFQPDDSDEPSIPATEDEIEQFYRNSTF